MVRKYSLSFVCAISLLVIVSDRVAAEPFVYSTDGAEVTDLATGLTWRRCAEGMNWVVAVPASSSTCLGTASTFTHETALQHAASEATATNLAWRLPNVKELTSIVNTDRFSPAVDSSVFPATPNNFFWASTPDVTVSGSAWTVYFLNGTVGYITRDGNYSARLVRDAQ